MRIGLRVWSYQPVTSWDGAGPLSRGNEVGDIALLSNHLRFLRDVRAIHFVSEYSYGLTAGLIGIAILALFLLRPQDKEYLWFAVLLLGECSDYAVHLAMNLGSLPMPLWYLLHVLIDSMSMLATLAFFSIVLHARRSLLWRAICVLVAAAPLTAALIYFQWAGMGTCFALVAVCNMPAILWILGRLLLGAFRRDASARLLLVPVALEYGVGLADTVARVVWLVKGSKVFPSAADRTLVEWPFEVSVGDVIGFIFLLALLIFLVRRFSLARKEEERMAGEFEAAKTVQSLLIPAAPPATPGFAVENVYLPAQEVGGDFFQILPGDDGSLLIVVGDVSGKGLKAAMTVSAIIGALRGCNLRAPEKVLLHLNKALRGQMSGFFTCSAALIDPDGTLTIANAGHLSPYLNGEELEVNPGLPLGIADETGYPEVTYYFGPNDRLTFVSDGVVEAQSSSGELYGFGRTQSISNQSAESIARTAQQFGQEDDITVLTVTRTPQNQPAPVLADHEKGLIANLL